MGYLFGLRTRQRQRHLTISGNIRARWGLRACHAVDDYEEAAESNPRKISTDSRTGFRRGEDDVKQAAD